MVKLSREAAQAARVAGIHARAERRATLPPRFLLVPEVANLLGVSRQRAASMVAAGELPAIRIGRRYHVDRERLEREIDEQTAARRRAVSR